MRTKNSYLKKLLFEIGITQRALASETGIPEAIISMGIHGKYNFDSDEMARIAVVLKRPVPELFVERN